MLETDEVDDDYFTPVASTSLSNIFGKTLLPGERTENESLKYTAPKPQIVTPKPDDTKATSCAFACALVAYEWINNVYTSKGKVGFAILKVLKNETHNVVIYDSTKTTLSCTTASSKLEVTIKENNFISYYDDLQKYWSLYGYETDINKIRELLKILGVNIIVAKPSDPGEKSPKLNTIEKDELNSTENAAKQDVGSDTDSSINRKTKASILNRMANMGHSVLPPHTMTTEKISDSSDSNESNNNHIKTVKHKTVKCIVKRNTPKSLIDQHGTVESHKTAVVPRTEFSIDIKNPCISDNQQLVTLPNSNIISSTGNDNMNLFMTEQRISNSELRINMNRTIDKVDQILNKISVIDNIKDQTEDTSNINTQILQKLLKEYESKIQTYESLLKNAGIDINVRHPEEDIREVSLLKEKIAELDKVMNQKDNEISLLKNEAAVLRNLNDSQTAKQNNDLLETKISELQQELLLKNELLTSLNKERKYDLSASSGAIESKIKTIMNDTFQSIAANFENDETYSGETIKNLIASVIKKVTIISLKDS